MSEEESGHRTSHQTRANDVGQYKDEFLNGIKNATEDLSHLNGRSALPNEISDAVLKNKQHRQIVNNPSSGTFGYLEGNVDGFNFNGTMVRSGEPDNITEIFDASEVGGWLRTADSEYEMLNRKVVFTLCLVKKFAYILSQDLSFIEAANSSSDRYKLLIDIIDIDSSKQADILMLVKFDITKLTLRLRELIEERKHRPMDVPDYEGRFRG